MKKVLGLFVAAALFSAFMVGCAPAEKAGEAVTTKTEGVAEGAEKIGETGKDGAAATGDAAKEGEAKTGEAATPGY